MPRKGKGCQKRKTPQHGSGDLNDMAQLAGSGAMTVSRALRTPSWWRPTRCESASRRRWMNSAISPPGGGALASATSQTIVVTVPSLAERACGDMIAGLQQTPYSPRATRSCWGCPAPEAAGGQPAQQFPQHNPAAVVLFGDPGRSSGSACRRPACRWWRWEPWRAIPST